MSRKDTIIETLTPIYGSGPMAQGMADELDSKWEKCKTDRIGQRYAVHMIIWNWFAGGTTAEHAARKVIKAVEGEESELTEKDDNDGR